MAMSDTKEPPPKPTRIRTTSTSPLAAGLGGGGMISSYLQQQQNSPVTKAPAPLPRPTAAAVSVLKTTPQGGARGVNTYSNSMAVSSDRQLEGVRDTDSIRGGGSLPLQDSPGTHSRQGATLNNIDIPLIYSSAIAVNDNVLPRAGGAVTGGPPPAPPPKPKRISLGAPQLRAKPLSLQSIPLQPKVETPVRSTTSPASVSATSVASAAAPGGAPGAMGPSSPPTTLNRIPIKAVSNSVLASPPTHLPVHAASPPPPVKKPRSVEPSLDGVSTAAVSVQQRFRNQMRAPSSSPPPSMSMSHPNIGAKSSLMTPLTPEKQQQLQKNESLPAGVNPTLIGARSRLRSTSDAKASTSPAIAVSQTAKTLTNHQNNHNNNHETSQEEEDGFGFTESKGYASPPLVSPTYPPSHVAGRNGPFSSGNGSHGLGSGSGAAYGNSAHNDTYNGDDSEDGAAASAAAAEKLAASLHKIQALAHEKTEQMKQINYAEKRADLAEAVYEKSSLWRQRGAEWGGIAKRAWEDRGGMGGIAGGFADRWKRRDGVNDGMPDYSRPGPAAHIFGLPLEGAVRLSKISASTGVPAIVTRCIEYLDIMGVEEVGLYRVSGSTSNVARLKAMFDHGLDYDFLQKGNEPQNPHDVATLLKLYLRELPSPIIPLDIMSTFNSIDFSPSDSGPQQPLRRLKEALQLLPLENYILLGTLCQHLSNLADYESCTKMNISNLGLIFCPTLQIGSVLFKNLLGGDGNGITAGGGGDEERRKCLLAVWDDLERRHEEMENLEMIKDFEMGMQFEKNGDRAAVTAGGFPQDDSNKERERERSREGPAPGGESHEYGRQSWEEVDRDLLEFGSSPSLIKPATMTTTPRSAHSKGGSGSRSGGIFDSSPLSSTFNTTTMKTNTRPSEPPLDLYDELMTKELNEATNTPLIDLGLNDDEDTPRHRPQGQNGDVGGGGGADEWRRHAREPATNRRRRSPSPLPLGATRHERVPAVSIRY